MTGTPNERVTYNAYVAARDILSDHFGNSFQMTDLWNSGIPTLEVYSQSVSKQMYYFNRDLLAEPRDQIDPLPATYFFIVCILRFFALLASALSSRTARWRIPRSTRLDRDREGRSDSQPL